MVTNLSTIKPVSKAIIPVAGLGTRMLPATKAIPKELLPIVDKPIIQHVVEEAIVAGITEIVLVTRSGKEAIENHFDAHYELEHRLKAKGKKIIYNAVANIIPPHIQLISVRQQDALGLGDAILCAKNIIGDEPFAILLPDVLVMPSKGQTDDNDLGCMVSNWNQTAIGQIMVQQVTQQQVSQYGVVDIDNASLCSRQNQPIKHLVEKPKSNEAPSNYAVVGRYILPASIFEVLEFTEQGADGEIQLTDAMDTLLNREKLMAFLTSTDNYDCGNKVGFLQANLAMAMRDSGIKKILKDMLN